MPHEGFICDADGSRVGLRECEACARAGARMGCNQTAPIIRGIIRGVRSDDFGLSVTGLLSCPRKRRLMREVGYDLKPKESWWSYRGQLMHGLSEVYGGDDLGAVCEQRFTMEVAPDWPDPEGQRIVAYSVSGQPDLIYLDRKHLVDYKTTKRVPGPRRFYVCPETNDIIQHGYVRTKYLECPHCASKHLTADVGPLTEPKAYDHHVLQVNFYRLLLAHNGIEIDTAEIVYMDMEQQLRLPVELLSLEAATELVLARVKLHCDPELPDVLRDPQTVWECDYCPVRGACEERFGGPVGSGLVPTLENNGD
jgi:hypothetical protein